MAMVRCPECQQEISDRAMMCPHCGYPVRGLGGYEYRSPWELFGLPLVHIVSGYRIDPATGRLRIAKGIIAVGPIAVGGLAIGGSAFGVLSFGGAALGSSDKPMSRQPIEPKATRKIALRIARRPRPPSTAAERGAGGRSWPGALFQNSLTSPSCSAPPADE